MGKPGRQKGSIKYPNLGNDYTSIRVPKKVAYLVKEFIETLETIEAAKNIARERKNRFR